ncbi:MAG: helix-turn-helix domain-containing protein [Acidobacteria bacterium]|nr:helix-turn-helix domain-containing protein [Acidobacteriota bacterium]
MPLTRKQLQALRATVPATGNRVRLARKLMGWTQVELAAAAGLQQPYVSAVERGRYSVEVRNAWPLAVVFGCSIEDLFCPDGVKAKVAS